MQHDVRQQLRIPRCLVFKSSFNRPNLRYFVRKKGKSALEDIRNLMLNEFTDQR